MPNPERGVAFTMNISLTDTAARPFFRSNPTLATGDVKISKDNGAKANLASLPTVSPASSDIVKVDLSATEMDADRVSISFLDAAGAEWDPINIHLQTIPKLVVHGVVTSGGTTTSIPTSSLLPGASVTDQFKGRIVIFAADTATVALRGQATDITASTAGGVLTVTALTNAPASGDKFTIV